MQVMSVAEMKQEIHQRVDQYEDENILQQVLNMLVTSNSGKKIDASKHIQQLFAENDGLLKRLA